MIVSFSLIYKSKSTLDKSIVSKILIYIYSLKQNASKGLLFLIMTVAIGTVSVSARHNSDLNGVNAMEELALVMDAAQEFTAKEMGGSKHLSGSIVIIMILCCMHACLRKPRLHASLVLEMLTIILLCE